MNIDGHIEKFILAADAKALATYGTECNVVPVSSVKIVDDTVWFINYFMDKTVANIEINQSAAFVCWKAMMGYQLKGTIAYKTAGDEFDQAVAWIAEVLPDRIVKGLLVFTPEKIYDISPTKDTKQTFVHEEL